MKTTNSQLSCYTIETTIGKGTFGKVKKAIHNHTHEPVAIKILQKNKIKDVTDVQRVSRELHILKLVRHSAIAQLYEVIETPDTIFMIMQYAQNGEFFDYIMDARIKNQRQAHHYFAQIVSGLEYLHQLGVAHRDVKPQNMLLDVNNRVKIVDFGLSNMYKKEELLTTACGSPCYASPQMIRGQLYDPQLTDVWSLGIVLFTMVMAKLPFEDDNTSVLYSKIKSGIYLIDRKVSPSFKDLLSRLINVKPQQRLRLKGIKQHPWFTSFNKISSFGLNVGYDKIPIDQKIVKQMQNFGHAAALTKRYLEYNVKNQCTTTYYLFLKKQFKLGQENKADICSDNFDQQLSKPKTRKKRYHSIDFNALVQKIESKDVCDTRVKPQKQNRKCLSQAKQLQIDVRSVGRQSTQSQEWQNFGSNKSNPKKFQLYNLTVKYKSPIRLDTSSQLDRRTYNKKPKQDENQVKVFVNRLVRENRRLQTEHVRQIYTRDVRQSVNKGRDEVSEMFWKKKSNNTSKGLSKGIRGVSSKKGITSNVYH